MTGVRVLVGTRKGACGPTMVAGAQPLLVVGAIAGG